MTLYDYTDNVMASTTFNLLLSGKCTGGLLFIVRKQQLRGAGSLDQLRGVVGPGHEMCAHSAQPRSPNKQKVIKRTYLFLKGKTDKKLNIDR